MSNGLELMGTGRPVGRDPEFRASLDNMVSMAEKVDLTNREKLHVKALATCADGLASSTYF